MKVGDVMTRQVISITPEATVSQAAGLMVQARISGLPVVRTSGELVGIVTEGDLLRRAELGTVKRRPRWLEIFVSAGKLAEEFQMSHGRKVSEVMRTDVHTVFEDTSLADAVELMERHQIKRLPVVRNGRPVGMLTRSNLMQGLVEQTRVGAKSSNASDWAVREQIVAELQKQRWAPVYGVDISVRGGIAHLRGIILDERERGALIVAVENVPGVKEVHDHLALIEPRLGMLIYRPDSASN